MRPGYAIVALLCVEDLEIGNGGRLMPRAVRPPVTSPTCVASSGSDR
jgi:hypothetical protein